VQSDPNRATAHAGLAEVRERTGEPDAARQEAQKSITLQPNVLAYLVLGRLNLAANKLPESAAAVNDALKLEPSNANARGLAQALESRGQKLP
jgi:tetratricopeptide (TPR) repeat protein